LRLYDCERSAACVRVTFGFGVDEVRECNLLEEDGPALPVEGNAVSRELRAFGILTLRVIPSRPSP
jgi:alpha-mannosidase